MAKIKKVKKSTGARKKPIAKKGITTKRKPVAKNKEPEYMVQVRETENLRKDLLESLREVIIFMQGYENFKKVQQTKLKLFNNLKGDSKEINDLINKLKTLLPKGHLKPLGTKKEVKVPTPISPLQRPEMEEEMPETVPFEQTEIQPRVAAVTPAKPPTSELDELEAQLKEIEDQLRGMN